MGRDQGDAPKLRTNEFVCGDEEWRVTPERGSRGVGNKKPDRRIWAGKVVARRG